MAEEMIIQSIPADELPGGLRKRLAVPEGCLALLVEGNEVLDRRGPGEHHLGNWPKPAPDAVLLPQTPFDLRPRLQHLRSGDHQALDLVWPLTVQVQDPARFYIAWLAEAPDPATALVDLEDYLAGRLWDEAQEQAVQFTLNDMDGEEQVQSALGQALRRTLTSTLADVGLTLVGSQRPEVRTLDEEQAALEPLNLAARAARDARFEALVERLQDRQMLADWLQEWAAERGEGLPDAAAVDLLWETVDQGPEEAAIRARHAAQTLERQVDSLRITLQSERTENERRFRQLLTRLEKAESATTVVEAETVAEVDPARLLKRLLFALRVVGLTLTFLAALAALLVPELDQSYDQIHGVALLLTVVIGLLTVISDLWLSHRVRRVQRQATEEKRQESKASLRRRREADHLVRARVEAGLKQVADNLEAAWKKGYGEGGAARDLAVELRELARQAARFGEQEVRIANYQAGRYLTGNDVPDDHLATMLDLDEDLLARSQTLAQTAEALYEQVRSGQLDDARASLQHLDTRLNALRNRFTERGAYLLKPA